MPKFYFTYGLDPAFPFTDGWTEVEAPDMHCAATMFRSIHPDRPDDQGVLNCASVYTEDFFKATKMYKESNFGARCHERISFTRELMDAKNRNEHTATSPLEGGLYAAEN